MKAHGGTVVCSYGYGISPSPSRSAAGTVASFVHAGGKDGVLDPSIPFGSVQMTTPALVAKQKGCDPFEPRSTTTRTTRGPARCATKG